MFNISGNRKDSISGYETCRNLEKLWKAGITECVTSYHFNFVFCLLNIKRF